MHNTNPLITLFLQLTTQRNTIKFPAKN